MEKVGILDYRKLGKSLFFLDLRFLSKFVNYRLYVGLNVEGGIFQAHHHTCHSQIVSSPALTYCDANVIWDNLCHRVHCTGRVPLMCFLNSYTWNKSLVKSYVLNLMLNI